MKKFYMREVLKYKKYFLLCCVIFLAVSMLLPQKQAVAEAENGDQSFLFDEGEHIFSMTVVDKTVYVLTGNGLHHWSCSMKGVELLTSDIASGGKHAVNSVTEEMNPITGGATITTDGYMDYSSSVQHLMEDEGKLFALNSYTGAVFEIVRSWGKWKMQEVALLPWEEMVQGEGEMTYPKPIDTVIKEGKNLFVLLTNGVDKQLVVFDMQTGEQKEINTQHLQWIAPYKQGQLLGMVHDQDAASRTNASVVDIGVIEISSGLFTPLFTIDASLLEVQGLCYHQNLDQVLVAFSGRVMRWQEGELKSAAYLSLENMNQHECSMIEAENLYVLTTENELFIRNIDPAAVLPQPLVIEDSYHNRKDIKAFKQAYPAIPVVTAKRSNGVSAGQKILMKDNAVDIFVVYTSTDAFDSLKAKDYMSSLEGSSVLVGAVEGMYPQIKEAIYEKGQLVAFPKDAYLNIWYYNPALFTEIGVKPPLTWEEIINFYADWGSTYQRMYPDYMLVDFSHIMGPVYGLTYEIVESYMKDQLLKYGSVDFNREDFKKLVVSIDQRREDISLIENQILSDNRSFLFTKENVIKPDSDYGVLSNSELLYLIPAFTAGEEVMEAVSPFSVYMINPYSNNKENALLFLETIVHNMSMQRRICFYPGEYKPVYLEGVADTIRFYEERIEKNKRHLETAEPEEKAQINEMIEIDQNWLNQYLKEEIWGIPPTDIADYQALENRWGIIEYPLFGSSLEEVRGILQDFASATITPDELISKLNQKVQMMEWEKE